MENVYATENVDHTGFVDCETGKLKEGVDISSSIVRAQTACSPVMSAPPQVC